MPGLDLSSSTPLMSQEEVGFGTTEMKLCMIIQFGVLENLPIEEEDQKKIEERLHL
jgi:hypothetical protein